MLFTFNIGLDIDEINILSNLMLVKWYQRNANDISQLELHLQDTDFKTFAEANNFKEKKNAVFEYREMADYDINKYGYKHYDWTKTRGYS